MDAPVSVLECSWFTTFPVKLSGASTELNFRVGKRWQLIPQLREPTANFADLWPRKGGFGRGPVPKSQIRPQQKVDRLL